MEKEIKYEKAFDRIEKIRCPNCGRTMVKPQFRDSSSYEEYRNSGCCQYCQDGMF